MPPPRERGERSGGAGGGNEDEGNAATRFVNDHLKKVLTFLVVCSCIAVITGCIFVIADLFKSKDDNKDGEEKDQYSGGEKAAAIINYLFWLVLSLVLFLVEFEPLWVFNYALFLHFWPGRGFLQLYLGIQIVHEAANMGTTEVLGMEGNSLKNVVKAMGFCFVGTGSLYILLSCCCLRKESGVVKKVRGGKSRKEEGPGKTPVAHLALLNTMNNDGVEHLGEAILKLESQVTEEKRKRGIGGWWRKKFGDDEKPAAKKPAASSSSAAAPAESASIAKSPTHETPQYGTGRGGFDTDTREVYGMNPVTRNQPPVTYSDAGGGGDGDGDESLDVDAIKKRREAQELAAEAAYFNRKYPD